MSNEHPRNLRDLGAKRILSALGPQLAVAITGKAGTRFIRVETRELQIKQRTPDLEMHLDDPDLGPLIVIVEVQLKTDSDFPGRLAALTTWLAHDRGCPVIPVVIHMSLPGEARSAHFRYELGGSRIEVMPVEIVLADQDAREILEKGMDGPWWPFIPFMRHGDAPDVLERLMNEIDARPELEQVAEDMLRMAAHVVDLSQVKVFLEARMMDDLWDLEPRVGSTMWKWLVAKSEARGQALADARTDAMVEARVEALAEARARDIAARARAEGLQQEAFRMVKRAIARRFGMPDPDLSLRLESLHTEELEALLESLFDMTDPGELTAWLDRQAH